MRNRPAEIAAALARMVERGAVVSCALAADGGGRQAGWVRPADLEVAARLEAVRPRADTGVLLSPFDPVLWDRPRVERLFGFHQTLEIFKPAARREYGYYCMPVLAGERLIARLDLKADRRHGALRVVSCHREQLPPAARGAAVEAIRTALSRYGDALGLAPTAVP